LRVGVIGLYQKDCGGERNNWYYHETSLCLNCRQPKQTKLFTEHERKQNKEIDFNFAERYGLLANIFTGSRNFLPLWLRNMNHNSFDKEKAAEIVNQRLEKKQAGKKVEVYHLKD